VQITALTLNYALRKYAYLIRNFQELHKFLFIGGPQQVRDQPRRLPGTGYSYHVQTTSNSFNMMSSYDDTSPVISPRNSIRARSETPDIIEPAEFEPGGFNLADELAMAEDSDDGGFLAPSQNRNSAALSDYEGSEYGDPDDDSDGYLADHVGVDEQQLRGLVEEFVGRDVRSSGAVGRFIQDLRGMRGQMDVENNARR
jgi:hypothetical protein